VTGIGVTGIDVDGIGVDGIDWDIGDAEPLLDDFAGRELDVEDMPGVPGLMTCPGSATSAKMLYIEDFRLRELETSFKRCSHSLFWLAAKYIRFVRINQFFKFVFEVALTAFCWQCCWHISKLEL